MEWEQLRAPLLREAFHSFVLQVQEGNSPSTPQKKKQSFSTAINCFQNTFLTTMSLTFASTVQ